MRQSLSPTMKAFLRGAQLERINYQTFYIEVEFPEDERTIAALVRRGLAEWAGGRNRAWLTEEGEAEMNRLKEDGS